MNPGGIIPKPASGPGLARPRLPTLHPADRAARFRVADAFDAYLRRNHIANTDAARAMRTQESYVRDMRVGLRPVPMHKLCGFPPHHAHALSVLLLEAGRERAA